MHMLRSPLIRGMSRSGDVGAMAAVTHPLWGMHLREAAHTVTVMKLHVEPEAGLSLAVLTFGRIEGAESAFANARAAAGQGPWVNEVAFVQAHRRGRILVRGTFAGHDLAIHDLERAQLSDPRILSELRADVPEGSSAVVVLAPRDHVDAVVAAFAGRQTRTNRHQISALEAARLSAAVAPSPAATAPGIPSTRDAPRAAQRLSPKRTTTGRSGPCVAGLHTPDLPSS
jgi:hypothetical protein